MKSILFKVVFILTMVFFIGTPRLCASPTTSTEIPAQEFSLQYVLNITPHQYTALTGNKLSFTQVLKLKLAQNIISKKLLKGRDLDDEPLNQKFALLLCLFVGFLGIHRFYLGYTSIGIIQALTFGGCFIWATIDLFLILTGYLKPANGSEYYPTLEDQ